jgi:hypothetical protein
MHVSPLFNFAGMSARMRFGPPGPPSARRIEVEALDRPFATPAPRRPVRVPSFAKRDDDWP